MIGFLFYELSLMTAFRTLIDAGIVPSAGSDFSPGPFSPLMALQGMVTRTGWNGGTWGANQRISMDEALRVNTINGAYNSCEEAIKGSSGAWMGHPAQGRRRAPGDPTQAELGWGTRYWWRGGGLFG